MTASTQMPVLTDKSFIWLCSKRQWTSFNQWSETFLSALERFTHKPTLKVPVAMSSPGHWGCLHIGARFDLFLFRGGLLRSWPSINTISCTKSCRLTLIHSHLMSCPGLQHLIFFLALPHRCTIITLALIQRYYEVLHQTLCDTINSSQNGRV